MSSCDLTCTNVKHVVPVRVLVRLHADRGCHPLTTSIISRPNRSSGSHPPSAAPPLSPPPLSASTPYHAMKLTFTRSFCGDLFGSEKRPLIRMCSYLLFWSNQGGVYHCHFRNNNLFLNTSAHTAPPPWRKKESFPRVSRPCCFARKEVTHGPLRCSDVPLCDSVVDIHAHGLSVPPTLVVVGALMLKRWIVQTCLDDSPLQHERTYDHEGRGGMKARVHGYPRHYHREAHLNIGAGRECHAIHHLCLPEMLQTRGLSAESNSLIFATDAKRGARPAKPPPRRGVCGRLYDLTRRGTKGRPKPSIRVPIYPAACARNNPNLEQTGRLRSSCREHGHSWSDRATQIQVRARCVCGDVCGGVCVRVCRGDAKTPFEREVLQEVRTPRGCEASRYEATLTLSLSLSHFTPSTSFQTRLDRRGWV